MLNRVQKARGDDPNTILNVPVTADRECITASYRQHCLLLHPDKCSSEGAGEAFVKIQNAYRDLLSKIDQGQASGMAPLGGGISPEQAAAAMEAVLMLFGLMQTNAHPHGRGAGGSGIIQRVCRGAGCLAEAAGSAEGLCELCAEKKKTSEAHPPSLPPSLPGLSDKCIKFGCLRRADKKGELCFFCQKEKADGFSYSAVTDKCVKFGCVRRAVIRGQLCQKCQEQKGN